MFCKQITESPSLRRANKENSPKYCSLVKESNISHKIINEVLNTGSDYLLEQIDKLDSKIFDCQNLIKQKIGCLLNESTSLFEQSHNQKKLGDLRQEESKLQQIQIDNERQQNIVFDFYEQEFNKLKNQYDQIDKDHQTFLKAKTNNLEMYNQMLETKAMLQEDLNAKLLQRAELVGHKEELEEFVEQIKNENSQLTEIVEQIFQCNKKTEEYDKQILIYQNQIMILHQQQDEKKKQLSQFHQTTLLEVQLHQQNQKVKSLKNKIVPIQKSLNLQHPDSILNDFINQIGNQLTLESIEFQSKLTTFIQIFRNNLFKQINSGNNWGSIKEFVIQLEQFIITSLQQKAISNSLSDLKNKLKQFGDEVLLSNEVCTIDFQVEVKKQQIKDLEEQKHSLTYRINILQEQFQDRVKQLTEEAFQLYIDQNNDQIQMILQEYGENEYKKFMNQTLLEMSQLISDQEQDQFQNTYKLLNQYYSQDKAIQVNIQIVDAEIIPSLKNIHQQIMKSKKELEKGNSSGNCSEKSFIDKQGKIEEEIQHLELEFKKKIEQFNNQDQEVQKQLVIVKQDIENTQELLMQKNKPNKALLEQEILQLNNVLTQLQDQKKQFETSSFNRSPSKVDISRRSSNGILAISKSLNQFQKNRKEALVTSFNNSVVKGITPTKEAANLYLINKYSNQKISVTKSTQELRLKSNISLKSIK